MSVDSHSHALPANDGRLYFDAILHPHRSLSLRQFRLLMIGLSAAAAFAVIVCTIAGAWPVGVFHILGVAAVYFAFRLNYRSGRRHETVQLSERELTVRKVQPGGGSKAWSFNPYWVRVVIENRSSDRCRVFLASHGRRVSVGGFLTSDERLDFASALEDALCRLRSLPLGAS
jgi:uncharacterized membrane protein